jgi:hypothetical protein
MLRVGCVVFAVLSLLAACGKKDGAAVCGGDTLFGMPTAATGLSSAQCGPTCTCSGAAWTPPAYTAADADSLLAWTLLDPPAPLTSDPYAAAGGAPVAAEASEDDVCAIVPDAPGATSYRLQTFPTQEAAEGAGAMVTHFGACGLCSTLADLAVYMRTPDLTAPVQKCGTDHLNGPPEAHIQCLRDLGFTEACADIWYYNTRHTLDACARPCFLAVGEPYHFADGGLNDCLRCDEDESGAVFKAVAGRTRRNTGLPSSMCRPCSEVKPLVHTYALGR